MRAGNLRGATLTNVEPDLETYAGWELTRERYEGAAVSESDPPSCGGNPLRRGIQIGTRSNVTHNRIHTPISSGKLRESPGGEFSARQRLLGSDFNPTLDPRTMGSSSDSRKSPRNELSENSVGLMRGWPRVEGRGSSFRADRLIDRTYYELRSSRS